MFASRRLGCMGVLCRRAVTLMALLTEAFVSPVGLNTNGLCFDFFPPVTRQERATHKQTHRGGGYFGEEKSMQEGAPVDENPAAPPKDQDEPPRVRQTETTWMITWLMSLNDEMRITDGAQTNGFRLRGRNRLRHFCSTYKTTVLELLHQSSL